MAKEYITKEEFKKYRYQLGESQSGLIELLHNSCGLVISKSTISMIESGSRKCAVNSDLYNALQSLIAEHEVNNPDFKSEISFQTKPSIHIVDPNDPSNYVNCSTTFELHVLVEKDLPETTQVIIPDERGYINAKDISFRSETFVIQPNYVRSLSDDLRNGDVKEISIVYKEHEKTYYDYTFYNKEDALDFIMDNVLTIYDIQNVLHGLDIYTIPLSLPTSNNGLNYAKFRVQFRKLKRTVLDEEAAYQSIKNNFEKWDKKAWSSANGNLPLLVQRGIHSGKFKAFCYIAEEFGNVTSIPLILGYVDCKNRNDLHTEVGAMSVYYPIQDGYHIGAGLLKFMRLYSMEKGLWLCTSERNNKMLNVLKRMNCFHQFKFVDENGISSNQILERFNEAGELAINSFYFCSDSLLQERKKLGYVPEKTTCGY